MFQEWLLASPLRLSSTYHLTGRRRQISFILGVVELGAHSGRVALTDSHGNFPAATFSLTCPDGQHSGLKLTGILLLSPTIQLCVLVIAQSPVAKSLSHLQGLNHNHAARIMVEI